MALVGIGWSCVSRLRRGGPSSALVVVAVLKGKRKCAIARRCAASERTIGNDGPWRDQRTRDWPRF